MREEVIGRRYAKALLLLGKEENKWERVGRDLKEFVTLFEDDPILGRVLTDPVHDRKKRKAILLEVLKRLGTDSSCSHFLSLLIDKERIRYLPAICKIYGQLEDQLAGRLRAKIVVARRLGMDQINAIQKTLESRFNRKILLEQSEDPGILGGIVCKVDGMVFDGSVKTQLEILRESMRGE